MSLPERSERLRRRILSRWGFCAYLWRNLPLAGFAGLKLRRLDDQACEVSVPGGWRTQNPFASTYFAAQAMAAEMSTGAPALVLAAGASASVAALVVELRASFVKRIVGPSVFTFSDMAGMRTALERAASASDPERFTARSVGRSADGAVASEFAITWSFKRRS